MTIKSMYDDLQISLISWSNMSLPHMECSALHTIDLSKKKLRYSFLDDKPVYGIIAFGCYSGELIRFLMLSGDVKPASVSFAHKSKIIAIGDCNFHKNSYVIASLSFDGLLCLWSVQDGLCLGKYTDVFPSGCQLMATSDETIVVSGSFPNVYIFNTSAESVTKILHPHYSFTAGIGIIPSGKCKVLFLVDSKGTVTYASVDPNLEQTSKYQLLDPNNVVIRSLPSPSFKFLLTLYEDSFSITDLTAVGFPSINTPYKDINTATWIDDSTFGVLSYSGSYTQYEVTDKYDENAESSTEEEEYFEEEAEDEVHESPYAEYEEVLNPPQEPEPEPNPTASHIDYLYSQLTKDLSYPDAEIFGRNRNDFNSSLITLKRNNLHIDELYTAKGTFPFGFLTSFKKEIIAGFNDTVIFLSNNFDEFSLGQMFETGPRRTTAQCLNIQNDMVKEIIDGTEDGSIIFYDLHTQQTSIQENVHKGRINEICTFQNHLFSAGDDNSLVVTNLDTKKPVKVFQHFMSRITQFLRPQGKIRKPFCDFLFCLTEFGAISVIDTKQLENVFNMTGHDGDVTSIMIHPLSGMLIVNAKSLFFWSLHSGNLESILRGNRKEIYLKDAERNNIPVKPIQDFVNGICYEQLLFGGNSLRVIDVNIKTVSTQIHNYLQENASKDLKTTIANFPNLGLMTEVFSTFVCDFLKKEIGKDYGHYFNICFVGDSRVHTVNLIKQKNHNDIWTFSSEVSSMILSMRILLSIAMRVHPALKDLMDQLINQHTINISSTIKHFKSPNIKSLFKYFMNCGPIIINYFMEMIELYPEEIRKKWLAYLMYVEGVTSYRRDLIATAWVSVSTTLLQHMSDSELKLTIDKAEKLVVAREGTEYKKFIPEVLYRYIEKFRDLPGVSDKLIKILVTTDYSANMDLSRLFNAAPIGFLMCIRAMSSEGKDDIAKKLIDVVINHILQEKVRDDIQFQMIQTIIGCSKEKMTDHIHKSLKALSARHQWFHYNQELHIIAYGNNLGTLFVTKKLNTGYRSSILSLAKEPISAVSSDSNGNLSVLCSKSNILFEIGIKVTDDAEHIQLDVLAQKTAKFAE